MAKKNTANDTDLAQRLDEVLGGDAPTSSYDSSCSDGSCSTGAAGADIDPRTCPSCGKPQSYQYNMAHLMPGREKWPGCLCG